MKPHSMTPVEKRSAYTLASIYSLRMLGLFMILPVFSLYAEQLDGVKEMPILIGLAIGIYGLTQALLQIPFGMLSDRFGRKPIITLGLLIFALGSVVAASADSIVGIIIGRALQGSGAIAAAIMALAADMTREDHRSKAMAVIGMTIGLSFAVSMVLGPVLNGWIGVPGIFWLTAVLALFGIVVLHLGIPRVNDCRFHHDTESVPNDFFSILSNAQLLRLDFGIFVLHMILTASFVVLPFVLRDYVGLESAQHWMVYLPVLLLSLIVMVPLIIVAEKYRHLKRVFVIAIVTVAAAEMGLMLFHQSLLGVVLSLGIFFIAFNVLEALLPSLIAKLSPAEKKGTAMGVYSTSQFLGAFIGGVMGGGLYGLFGLAGVFGFCAFMAGIWGLWASTMQTPRYLSSYMINVGQIDIHRASEIERQLQKIAGVAEVKVVAGDGVAYLKIDSRIADLDALKKYSVDQTDEVKSGDCITGKDQTSASEGKDGAIGNGAISK